nr:unnamed protein product [Callosobruchus chinensis]
MEDQWILDPETRVVSLSHSLSNHPFFILSTTILITILLLGVHKRVIAASIITSRTEKYWVTSTCHVMILAS